jgi:hypothetical protein
MDRREYEKARGIKVLEFPMCPETAPASAVKTAVTK